MRKYLKESLHWIHLAVFKPITLEAETRELSTRNRILLYLKILPIQLAIIMSVVAFVRILFESAGILFTWPQALASGVVAGLGVRLGGGLERGLRAGLVVGLASGLLVGMGDRLNMPPGVGLVGGLCIGLAGGLGVALVARLLGGVGAGLVGGLVAGLSFLMAGGGPDILFALSYAAVFIFAYVRPFYIIPHAVQSWRSYRAADPFAFFRNSPVYWDEAIAISLPFLTDWLTNLAMFDRERGMNEIATVARLPYQRRAAQRALINLLVGDLQQADSLEKMASASNLLSILPSDGQSLAEGFDYAARQIRESADLASDYLTRVTPVGRMRMLRELLASMESFRDWAVLIGPPVGSAFQSVASRWLVILKEEEVQIRERLAIEPIPNPFVVGNPLMVRDKNLFKGRKDIIVAIEENIINPAQRPALLLYGRRRIGKTSTLLNLPALLSSQFVPVFIDCQDAKWREGDDSFCYHLAASIHDALNQRSLVETTPRPRLELFERYAFTRLGEYLDRIEETSRAAHKQILLTFDEYEKLAEGTSASKVTLEILNQLRTILQHRERIVVLFSGGHRFEEMRTLNWSDYLINVKTLELSFLAEEDARELITEPVPLLQYESGIIKQIIEMTHCQPYLLQAVASDLVNYLNSERRMLATAADLEITVDKVLVTADAYFDYTWRGDCSVAEREVLRMIAIGDANNGILAEHQASLQSLCHKEILERHASGYRFSIELFRRWVLKNQTAQPFTPGDLSEPAELEYAAS